MSTAYTTSMFDKIRGALTVENSQNNKFRDIMKLTPTNTYTVRLLPNLESPEKTFFHFYSYGWESFATGQYVNNISPQTWGEKDPVAEARYSLGKHGTSEEKAKASKVIRSEKWLANVFVVSDPTNSENEGKVKILRFGKQLYKIIMEAIEGEDSDEFGSRIFDLTNNGCNLKIKCEKQGEYPTYVSSRFASSSKLVGAPKDVEQLYEQVNDLETVFPVKSYDDLKGVLNEHFYCSNSTSEPSPVDTVPTGDSVSSSEPDVSLKDVDPLDDDKVKELLEGLE
jgi:hypothetical protein